MISKKMTTPRRKSPPLRHPIVLKPHTPARQKALSAAVLHLGFDITLVIHEPRTVFCNSATDAALLAACLPEQLLEA